MTLNKDHVVAANKMVTATLDKNISLYNHFRDATKMVEVVR